MKEVLQCVSLESEQIAAFLTRFLRLYFSFQLSVFI